MDEKVVRSPEGRRIIHQYGEPLYVDVLAYSLKEIVAEKLRALLQQANKLERRSWSRLRARGYYDLWRVLGEYSDLMNLKSFESLMREKYSAWAVSFTGSDDFFHDSLLAYVEETWEQWLGPLVPGLPSFDTVINGLRPQVAALVSSGSGGVQIWNVHGVPKTAFLA